MKLEKLSKAVSHALSHEPWLYELELDDEGLVPVEELLPALRSEKPEWSTLSEASLAEMIAAPDNEEARTSNGRIRTLYGHSVPVAAKYEPILE